MGKTDTGIMSFRDKVLFPPTKKALDYLSKQSWIGNGWYLAGGTSLTLQWGHRQSVDLDFFTPEKDFETDQLIGKFQPANWKTTKIEKGTVYGELFGVKISFIAYPWFIPQQRLHQYGTVRILDDEDIVVMKILAISQRGAKRDFYDLYWYSTQKNSLVTAIESISSQYPNHDHNFHHILKSLTYFDDAEDDPDPVIFFEASWQKIKEYFLTEVPKISKEILDLE